MTKVESFDIGTFNYPQNLITVSFVTELHNIRQKECHELTGAMICL